MPEQQPQQQEAGDTDAETGRPRRDSMQRRVHRTSITEQFDVHDSTPIPDVPTGGARVKVYYAGATYSDRQLPRNKHVRTPGIHDTSLFPGYEISGVVDKICNQAESCTMREGDRVIVYPEDNEEYIIEAGFSEYVIVHDVRNLIAVPASMPLRVAALLPCGALLAYSAVQRVKPFIEQKLHTATPGRPISVLVVGAGGLGLWTLKMAHFLIPDSTNVHITVADVSIEKLMLAKDQGCYDVIHWNDSIHEEYILERTKDVCKGGVDVGIDFVSSPRTVNRLTKVLKQEGVIVVGGHSKYEVNICLNTLARNNQSILGVKRGKRAQLVELIDIVDRGEVAPPRFTIFPVEEVNKVFEQLQECRINGRAVIEILPEDTPAEDENKNIAQ